MARSEYVHLPRNQLLTIMERPIASVPPPLRGSDGRPGPIAG